MEPQGNADVCPNCLEQLSNSGAPFCRECGAPVGPFAVLDPINAIQAEGHAFRRGADRPNLLILFGVWLIFLPTLLIGIFSVANIVEVPARLFFLVVLCAIPVGVLARTTSNYFTHRRKSLQTHERDE